MNGMTTSSNDAHWFRSALILGFLGPALLAFQLFSQRLTTPWYMPALGTLAAGLALCATLKRRTLVRTIMTGLLILVAAFEWWLLLGVMKLPVYSGPLAVGKAFPAFTSNRADGTSFDQTNLAGPETTALIFFRGRWCPVCLMELDHLERRQEDFARKNIRVVVVSLDDKEKSAKTQAQFPHLTVVADSDKRLINAAGVLHEKANPDGNDAAAPTTILIDKAGVVRWIFRPDGVLRRLTPDEILNATQREVKE